MTTPITLDDYQEFTRTTAKYPKEAALPYCVLGLTGEAGEVANNFKKVIRDGVERNAQIVDELGDVLWYVARTADEMGYTLEQIAAWNISKLVERHQDHLVGLYGNIGDDNNG